MTMFNSDDFPDDKTPTTGSVPVVTGLIDGEYADKELAIAIPTFAPVWDALELAISGIDETTPSDRVKELYSFVENAKRRIKEWDDRLKEAMIPVVKRDGDFRIGPVKFWIGHTKPEPKCVSAINTLHAMIRVAEKVTDDGEAVTDWSIIAGCLSSNAWKPATTMAALGKESAALFVADPPKEKLESDAPKEPRKARGDQPALQSVNTDFI